MPHAPQPRYHPMLRIFSLLPLLEKFNIVVLLLSRCRRHGITESVGRSSCVTAHKMRCKVTKKNPNIQIFCINSLKCPHFCIIIPHNSGEKERIDFYFLFYNTFSLFTIHSSLPFLPLVGELGHRRFSPSPALHPHPRFPAPILSITITRSPSPITPLIALHCAECSRVPSVIFTSYATPCSCSP